VREQSQAEGWSDYRLKEEEDKIKDMTFMNYFM
jgi:hypothetical protein